MPAKKEKEVNLLPQEEFEGSTLGRILKWALSTFRIMVIITEMVVMLAFLSRFWLDARSTDLNELITQKQAAIAADADFEKEFKDTQKRLRIFANLTSANKPFAETLKIITSYLPADSFLASVSFNGESFQVKGITQNEISIAQFIANLKASQKFKEVSLVGISSSEGTDGSLIFTIKLAK